MRVSLTLIEAQESIVPIVVSSLPAVVKSTATSVTSPGPARTPLIVARATRTTTASTSAPPPTQGPRLASLLGSRGLFSRLLLSCTNCFIKSWP